MGREDTARCTCMGPETEAIASKSFNVFNESGTSGPVTEMGRRAGPDRCNCVWDSALSRDSLEMDFGASSVMGADRAEAQDVCVRGGVPELPIMSGNEAAPQGVKGKDRGLWVCCCLRVAT